MHLSGKVIPMPDEPTAPVSPESIIESVRFTRHPASMFCHAEQINIKWTNPDGTLSGALGKSCKVCDLDHDPDIVYEDATILVAASVTPKVLAYVVAIPQRFAVGGYGDPHREPGVSPSGAVWEFDYQARIVLMPEPVSENTAEMLKSFSGGAALAMLEGQGVFPAPIHEENIYRDGFPNVMVIDLDLGDVSLP